MADALSSLAEWGPAQVKSAVHSVGERLQLRGRDLYQPIRAALTGRMHGPELPVIIELLGRITCDFRLRSASWEGQ
jgi:nondiscriminating glutamyl-tRNA synthetase